MSDQPADLVLVFLRRLDAKMDRLIDDVHDAKVRLTGVEEAVAGCNRRLDRLETRIERIERRLDLIDLPTA